VPLRISRRSQLKFAEFATRVSTVNRIYTVFKGEGFEANPNEEDAGGERRTACESFQSLIDPDSPSQQRRLLRVYLDALESWNDGRNGDGSFISREARDVVRSLRWDGIPVDDGGHLTAPLPEEADLEFPNLQGLPDPDVLREHLRRMTANLEHDTPAVIGSAKELLESVCKVILDDAHVGYPPSASLPDLYKLVATELRLARDSVPQNAKGSEAAQRVLQGLVTAVQNLAELRNALGLGHGRAQRVPALERHARLAMNASYAASAFLLSTWTERQRAANG
jgi:plasmid stabilization system protein ParE